jgi:DNA-directed RNA polymerase subunit RPC12/RpoP
LMVESEKTRRGRKPERFPCPGCGADLVFDPKENCLSCPYCGRKEPIPRTDDAVIERPYEQYLHPSSEQMGTVGENALEVSCARCGATVTFTPPEVAGECPFCGSSIVAQPKSADPMVAPEGLLPFYVTQQQANESIKRWLSSRWFAPNALKRLAYQESIRGVYLPFWTYDAMTDSRYTGERGEHYYVTETYTDRDAQGNSVTRTRQVQRTHWYSASGEVSRRFDDVLVAATRSVSRPRLAALEPWDLGVIRPYDPAYIAGYKAQRYEVGLAAGFEEAKTIMAGVIEDDVRKDIGGDEQRIHNIDTSYSGITFKHLLLPVYIGAYRFNQKIYQVMINARTGEVQGDRPYSIWKIAFFILFLLLVTGIVLYLKNN